MRGAGGGGRAQIVISYGRKCDAEFLAHYGFVPPNNSAVPCKPDSPPSNATAAAPGGGGGGNATDGADALNISRWRADWRPRFARFLAALDRGLLPAAAALAADNATAPRRRRAAAAAEAAAAEAEPPEPGAAAAAPLAAPPPA